MRAVWKVSSTTTSASRKPCSTFPRVNLTTLAVLRGFASFTASTVTARCPAAPPPRPRIDQRGVGPHRLFRVEHRGEDLVRHRAGERVHTVRGGRLVLRQDRRHGVPGEAGLAGGEEQGRFPRPVFGAWPV